MARVVLVGLPGTGKSTVARALAERLGVEALDTDELIEPGREPGAVLRELGESEFRRREVSALHGALERDAVVATGGGVVTTAAGRRELLDQAVVWLRARPEDLVGRVGDGDRPLLDGDVQGRLAELDAARGPLYASVAGVVVDATSPVADIVDQVIAWLDEGAPCE